MKLINNRPIYLVVFLMLFFVSSIFSSDSRGVCSSKQSSKKENAQEATWDSFNTENRICYVKNLIEVLNFLKREDYPSFVELYFRCKGVSCIINFKPKIKEALRKCKILDSHGAIYSDFIKQLILRLIYLNKEGEVVVYNFKDFSNKLLLNKFKIIILEDLQCMLEELQTLDELLDCSISTS